MKLKMVKNRLELLRGLNPDNVKGYVLKEGGLEVFPVPDRALEPLDVLVDGQPVMFRSRTGHLRNLRPADQLAHIEGFFTGGLDNTGGPNGLHLLHGQFSLTPANKDSVQVGEGSVQGIIPVGNMVFGPYIEVAREIKMVPDKHAFTVKDVLHAETDSPYMLLYHPNFPVVDGTEVFVNARKVTPRDLISNCGINRWNVFENVGRGLAVNPPTQPNSNFHRVREENFERCYVIDAFPDNKNDVWVALLHPDRKSASYIRYNQDDFGDNHALQLWKNPRGKCAGLEIGTTFMGRSYAASHNLTPIVRVGTPKEYTIEVGFLTTPKEVDEFFRTHNGNTIPEVIEADGKGPGNSHSTLWQCYKK